MTASRMAVFIGLVFAAGFSFNLWMVRKDRLARTQIEVVDQPSAVGDKNYFEPPKDTRPKDVSMRVNGRLIRAVDGREERINDGAMRRAMVEDSGMFVLYRLDERELENEPEMTAESLFLKVGHNEFMRLEYADE